jgi:beta-lactam-binding protein with PASTA domain/predicted Ser/Thr protein kinase
MERTIGERYRVEARIGQGGMAEVYRGFDPSLDRTVAIKVLLPPFDRDAGFVARFRREAQAAAPLNHPNIVGVYDAGADGDTQYIVMEYVEGRTLASFVSGGGKPTTAQAIDLTIHVASALQAAHERGIVHRDIKPANIMVTRAGAVKVMDFGIARIQTDATAPQTSSVIGTPAYFSPEQAQGQPVDARSDIYSLGCVLYELLAHRQPFSGDTPVAIAFKQVNEMPVPPSEVNPDVPPRLDAVVMKCMAKNPANRYQSAAELIADLERVRAGQEVEATPLMPVGDAGATQVIARQPTQVMPPSEPEGSSRKMWLGALIALLVILLLLGGGYLLAQALNNDQPPAQVQVANVIGKQYEDAKSALEAQGFVVQRGPDRETDAADPNTVVKQDPFANTLVDAGTTVTLTVAVPPPKVIVPNLQCQTPDAAASALQPDLSLGTQTSEPSDACQPGQIVAQDPKAFAKVQKGTIVNVTVSSGPASFTLGDYSCQTFNKVKHDLEKAGIVVNYGGTVPSLPQCPNPNFVAQQSPGANTTVNVGDTVTLYTGSGTPSSSTTPSPTP